MAFRSYPPTTPSASQRGLFGHMREMGSAWSTSTATRIATFGLDTDAESAAGFVNLHVEALLNADAAGALPVQLRFDRVQVYGDTGRPNGTVYTWSVSTAPVSSDYELFSVDIPLSTLDGKHFEIYLVRGGTVGSVSCKYVGAYLN